MKVSLQSMQRMVQRYGCADDLAPLGVDDVAAKIGAQLGGIDEVIDIGKRFTGIVIVKVVACAKHPNADKLNVCLIDDGGKVQAVERNADGLVQVVCGAPNVRAGLTVAWLPPGVTVPDSVAKDPFVLGVRQLRGVVSNGMLASPRELTLGDSHDGILEIDGQIAAGTDFAEQFGLAGDVVFNIENKMFTHRPDCFGYLGVAREVAGIQGMPFRSPEWYSSHADIPAAEAEELALEVRNELPGLVPRFTAVTMRDVQVGPSPVWLQVELVKAGLRPINNIVDLTNFIMLETGQPLHAYDYDKVRALDTSDTARLVVRLPKPGEKLKLLNGKEIEPRAEAIMISTEQRLIGVGGVMGGAETEVDDTTTNIIIEAANFDMYSIRRTSMAHGLFTDAVTRFNKGQSPLQNRAVVAKMVNEVRLLAGGKVAGTCQDIINLPAALLARNAVHPAVQVTAGFINTRLGLQLDTTAIRQILANVEFAVTVEGDVLTVKAPFWRTDIELPEDVVEEVGRLYGYDRLPLQLPLRRSAPAWINPAIHLKQQLRDALSAAGANEVLTYSFVHGRLLDRAGQQRGQAYQLSNALSPDLQYYRLSLTPSLLERIHPNIKASYDRFALFEFGKGHIVGQLDDEGLPREFNRLALVFAADKKAAATLAGAAYYQARQYLQTAVRALGLGDLTFDILSDDATDSASTIYAPGRAAKIMLGGVLAGWIGEYKPGVRQALKLPEYCAGFELNLEVLQAMTGAKAAYRPLPRFPKIEQDLCLRTPVDVPYATIINVFTTELAEAAPDNVLTDVTPLDIYQRPDDAGHKQTTLRLSIASYDKTLRTEEVEAILSRIAAAASQAFGAERI